MIKLHNNLTRKLEAFTPIDPKNVRVYACGPTVYDRAHIGNARPAVIFDVLVRLLRHEYGEEHVTYVRNITDVDDKINARAAESGRSIGEITAETSGWYIDDMTALGVRRPDHEPRATEFIPEMIEMIGKLIKRGHAYEAEGHVLFDVRSYEAYGALSRRSLDDMIAGARVEVAPYKRDPMDFVLWKPAGGGPGWESPWGTGRPGWHIECSAMAGKILGETFDIHAGGMDLQFPHHENEIAQSCACHGKPAMANYWIHNAMLNVDGVKMSKSLGNFFTVRDLLDQGISGEVMRFVLLSTHYGKTFDWTAERVEQAEVTLRKWRALTKDVEAGDVSDDVLATISDDLNSAGAITAMHALAKAGDGAGLKASAQLLGLLSDEMGGWDTAVDLSVYASMLSAVRDEAMITKDFSAVDAMKTALTDAGVEVRMSKDGVELVTGSGFDAEKLEGL